MLTQRHSDAVIDWSQNIGSVADIAESLVSRITKHF